MEIPVVTVNYVTRRIPDVKRMMYESDKDPLDSVILVIRSKDGFDIAYVTKVGRLILDYDVADIEMYDAIVKGLRKSIDSNTLEKVLSSYLKTLLSAELDIQVTVDEESVKRIVEDFIKNLSKDLDYLGSVIESHRKKVSNKSDINTLVSVLTQELDDECLVKVLSIINQKIYK